MKRCAECTNLVADEVEMCPECGGTEFRPQPPEVEAPTAEDPAQAAVAGDGAIAGEAAQAAGIRATDDAEAFNFNRGPAAGGAAETADDGPADEPVTIIDQAEVINSERQLEAIQKEDLFIVGLLGFSTGGKTWFLNRLKRSYQQPNPRQERRPACWPAPPAALDNSRVPRTNYILRHRFSVASEPELGFNLLDVPGERFQAAAEKNFVGVNDLILSALKACDALIIVLPADEILFAGEIADRDRCSILRAQRAGMTDPAAARVGLPPSDKLGPVDFEGMLVRAREELARRKGPDKAQLQAEIKRLEQELAERREWRLAEAANDIEDFASNIGLFAGILHLLEQDTPAAEIAAMASHAEIMRKVQEFGYHRRRKPVFVALSKMDAVIEPNTFLARKLDRIGFDAHARERLDLDPLGTLNERGAGIAYHARNAFEWCKVDAVTAFGGHQGGDIIHYGSCDVYGVDALIEWIHWARRLAKGPPWARWEANVARWLRRIRDMAA